MFKKLILLSTTICILFSSCKKEEVIKPKILLISGNATLTQKSFTPVAFDNGKATKAKIVQDFNANLSEIGNLTGVLTVDFDLVANKSGEVLAEYTDKDGAKIFTTSSSVANETGLNITEKITGGTGKFAKISGGGTYFINLNFTSGNGSGTLQWTISY